MSRRNRIQPLALAALGVIAATVVVLAGWWYREGRAAAARGAVVGHWAVVPGSVDGRADDTVLSFYRNGTGAVTFYEEGGDRTEIIDHLTFRYDVRPVGWFEIVMIVDGGPPRDEYRFHVTRDALVFHEDEEGLNSSELQYRRLHVDGDPHESLWRRAESPTPRSRQDVDLHFPVVPE